MNYEEYGLWFIPAFVVSLVVVVMFIVITESMAQSEERETLCVINGYDFVAYNSGNYYCIGNGTSKLIIRQNDKYELR